MSSYTASGARRTGDEYQDLRSAEVLLEWLEHPEVYRWVRLEAMDGSLDDIQAQRADGSCRLLQVKFGTDATVEWDWDELTKQESGKKGPKPSWLKKWKTSLDRVMASGITVSEVALVTNRTASAAIRAHLSDAGIVDFNKLSPALQATLSAQLNGHDAASAFFASFHFFFGKPSLEALDASLQRRFRQLGGTPEGWSSLWGKIRRWINRQDEPSPDGTIRLPDIRAAALWHLPPQIPQGFLIPNGYVVPAVWSERTVMPRLQAGEDRLVVVTGSPGAGKSTYLSWLVEHLRSVNVPVVRHHYFLSITDETPRRTEWETASDAIIGQLRHSYRDLVQTVDSQNPLPETLHEFLRAAGHKRAGIAPLVVIVDGLDHVWRDTGSEEGLRHLFDLLLPVPDGVVVVVGTQDIDIARIPRKLRELCPRDQWLNVPVLNGEGVQTWLQHHRHELGLPEDQRHADRVFDELVDAFRDVSGGHPLVLHYTLGAARQGSHSVRAEQVRTLPRFDPNSTIAAYYRALWDSISPEGHQLLHLLAGFPWAWPRDGLVQCLASQADYVRHEKAERAIRHVLGTSHAGVTVFHESLLAFVRALPEHRTAVQSLRPQVLNWLTHRAPEYWRWRHDWEERAKSGDVEPLIESATLDFCIDSLVAGRGRTEIADVVAASGWTALQTGRLGVATERHQLDAYLEEASNAEGALPRLVWLALHSHNPRSRDLELSLFASRISQATDEEIEAAAEIAFSAGRHDICEELFYACADRWDSSSRRSQWADDEFSSLQRVLPSLIAASLITPADGPYQRHVSKEGGEPSWCPCGRYAKALARLCLVGDSTSAIREELRSLANQSGRVSFEAVDEIVRLACRDGFDPDSWINHSEARRSGLYRCHRYWVRGIVERLTDTPREVSFLTVWQDDVSRDEGAFIELARSYFFACLAAAEEGRDPVEAAGLDTRASKVAEFLSLLRTLATEAAAAKKAGHTMGGEWLIARLAKIDPPEVKINDFANDLVRKTPVARVVVAITQDLEELYQAEAHRASLNRKVITLAIDGAWTWERVWIEDRVERRLKMGDFQVAEFLIDRERTRLERTRDYLHARAGEYACLAQFCQIHQRSADEVRELARLAARHLLGHGYHKDGVLFDVLAAIRTTAGKDKASSLAHLRSISPVIQVMDEITDGDETTHLKHELAEVVWEVAPEALAPYLRALQRNYHHSVVASCFTDLAESLPLEFDYEKGLATTLVHEEALLALQRRANGDPAAGAVLAGTLAYCGRQMVDQKKPDSKSTIRTRNDNDKSPPPVADYPPERLAEFVQAVRDARLFRDEPLAAWTTHWRSVAPDRLLAALTAYRVSHGSPLEKQTGRAIVELALERAGKQAAWDWLIAYHQAMHGWSRHAYELSDIEWIWELVRARFSDRWLDFISATSRPRWRSAGGAPVWSVERMVQFLAMVGELSRIDEVLDSAVRWGAGLAANMALPDPALNLDQPSLPVALRLLVDRLDCPSRMVQERAAWSLAEFVANPDSRDDATKVLLDWHAAEPLELRSCVLLLILHLAHTTRGVANTVCVAIARQVHIVPSIGTDMLLREFGEDGAALATALNYRTRHSGPPNASFSGIQDFRLTVGAHLAPGFHKWASMLDRSGIPFSRQWEWETVALAHQQGLSLRPKAHFQHHYQNHVDGVALAINDRLSVTLRSAYLRALHWSIDEAELDTDRAEIYARRVAVMADPALWAVRASERPAWWPADPNDAGELDVLCGSVGQAVRDRLERRDSDEEEILLFAAGPVGNRPRFRAEVVIRAFLQSAHGPLKPSQEELAALPWIGCRLIPTRLLLPGAYKTFEDYAFFIGDWLVAPLASWLEPDTKDWLLPERHARGLCCPATWLLPGTPTISTELEQVNITLDKQSVARYRYWHDELRERHSYGVGSRVGSELLVRREWVEPQLATGATLCWIVTLSVSQRKEHKDLFGEPQVVGIWVIGGSRMVWPEPWEPLSPDSPSSASELTEADDSSDDSDDAED